MSINEKLRAQIEKKLRTVARRIGKYADEINTITRTGIGSVKQRHLRVRLLTDAYRNDPVFQHFPPPEDWLHEELYSVEVRWLFHPLRKVAEIGPNFISELKAVIRKWKSSRGGKRGRPKQLDHEEVRRSVDHFVPVAEVVLSRLRSLPSTRKQRACARAFALFLLEEFRKAGMLRETSQAPGLSALRPHPWVMSAAWSEERVKEVAEFHLGKRKDPRTIACYWVSLVMGGSWGTVEKIHRSASSSAIIPPSPKEQ